MTRGRLARILAHRSILRILVQRDLRIRYARSFLGYLWTVIDPLVMACIYFVIFGIVFQQQHRAGGHPYVLYLLVGLLPWQWFNASVNESARALHSEAKLVRSTNLPRELWVVRVVIAKGIEFIFSLPVIIAFCVYFALTEGVQLNYRLFLIPVAIALQFLLQVGIGLMLAPATVLVDDSIRIVRIFLRVGFYLTPVIYSFDKAPEWLRVVIQLNPMTGILELYRAGFFHVHVERGPVVIGLAVIAFFLVAGSMVFVRLERSVLKEI